ncbi:MAG: imelysin family protein [Bacteroidota bacterium]
MTIKASIKLFLISVCIGFGACQSDDKEDNQTQSFDRKAMLQQYADGLIIPAYSQSSSKAEVLRLKVAAFIANPGIIQLEEARTAWKQMAFIWQHASGFNFGPAAEAGLKKSLNEEIATFPASKTKIEQYINAADTSFSNFDRDSRGIYAIDFLLFETGITDQALIEKYNHQIWRKHYLMACTNTVAAGLQSVSMQWTAYRESFIANNGTDIGSSVSYFYNEFLKSYEGLKNYKFGIPLGRRPGQTTVLPENVEAYHSGYSTDLAKEQWNCMQQIWEGIALDGTNGTGFKEYLQSVEGGEDLITLTRQQTSNTQQSFNALPAGKLSDVITQQFDKADAVHTELQKLTRFYKSDLSSLLGITITFNSGDGD